MILEREKPPYISKNEDRQSDDGADNDKRLEWSSLALWLMMDSTTGVWYEG